MNGDFVARHAGGNGGSRDRGGGILARRPNLDTVGSDMRGAILRLHGRMGEERHRVIRFETMRGAGKRRYGIAVSTAELRSFGIERAAYQFGNAGARNGAVAVIVPAHLERIGGALGLPPRLGHDCDRIRHAYHPAHAFV